MTTDELRTVVLGALGEIAPEMDPAALQPDAPLRDQLDIDSMDVLNFAIAIDEQLQIEIPESDYPQLNTLNGCIAYLQRRQIAETPTT